ncbi:MAG: bifunctional phosphopantothenoylcysteine decarboxylase/phosphopantothenate--cysteine ligase CoaBC [Prevotella sp.]|nr:bifunctional phosphopantothenoylcysteine decarboxylase/phosphopantothenate--cysteine ligase CoaBC [Prevotella sp.]MCM1074202.1 bifunctional phosphopantothenoylcysteine decarboxylase/phosphopantothenate--cysteine ligase CoaBC [Ruminococcus sp.]
MTSVLNGRHIVLGISGGIAAYKSVYLLRLLRKAGAEVQVVITPSGKEFITPVTLSALSGNPVISEFFTANTGEWHSHVDLGLWADAMIVAPATASTIAKMANGVADNMLITTYLSAKEHVFAAPTMDLDMYAHPSTQRNLATLKADGVTIIEPASGYLASGLEGKGRMEEPEGILRAVEEYFSRAQSLKGEKILITAGPTYENIDPVRFIGNYSSGKMGYALASKAAARGAEVVLVSGPVSLSCPQGVRRIEVTSAQQMLEACEREFSGVNVAVMCAAVADYRPAQCADSKLKREKAQTLSLELVSNPDIAATLGAQKKPGQKLIGFALETDNELQNALAKARRKNLDWIVLNSLQDPEAGFGKDTNKVTMIKSDTAQTIPFPAKSKSEVAADILDIVFK